MVSACESMQGYRRKKMRRSKENWVMLGKKPKNCDAENIRGSINRKQVMKPKELDFLTSRPTSKCTPNPAAGEHPEAELEIAELAPEGCLQHDPPIKNDEKMPQKPSSPKLVKSGIGEVSAPAQSNSMPPIQRVSTSTSRPADNAIVASRTQLPPDRLAAAKARLRVKSEERRKALGQCGQRERDDHGSSVVDWQNL